MNKHSRKGLLILAVLVLLVGIGAKMYSDITMSDDEWVGLGPNAGRIVFDNQATDEVNIMDARVSVGTQNPTGDGGYTPNLYIANPLDSTEWVAIGYDHAGDYGYVYAVDHAVGWKNLILCPVLGDVGIGDSTPSYDLDVAGDIRATDDVIADDDVTAGGSVFIGSEEDTSGDPEDGAHMSTRADNDDGGYMFYARRDVSGWNTIIFNPCSGHHGPGPDTMLWAQWLVKDNTTGTVTEGDTYLTASAGHGTGVLIGGSGDDTLHLWHERFLPPAEWGGVLLREVGSHTYDVALLIMWVED